MGGKNKRKNEVILKPSTNNKLAPNIPTNNWKFILIIIIINIIVFAKTLQYGFVNLDDTEIVENSQFFKNMYNIWGGFFASYSDLFYRPLLWASWIIDYQIGGTQPFIYHFSNLFYHIISCCLLFQLLILLNYNRKMALHVCLIFSVHPLFNQAIGWIPGRNDTLLAIFILLSIIQFIHYLNSKKLKNAILYITFFTIALFIKETAVVLPIICFLFYVCIFNKKQNLTNKNKYNLIFISLFVMIIWYIIRDIAMQDAILKKIEISPDLKNTPLFIVGFEAFLKNFTFIFESFGKLILPINLSVFASFSMVSTCIGIIGYLIILIIIILKKIPFKKILFYGGWWFLFIVPPIFIFFLDNRYDYLEHRIYIPAIGFFILLCELCKNISYKKFRLIIISIIVIFSIMSFERLEVFNNEENFYLNAVETSPNKTAAYKALISYYDKIENKEKAIYFSTMLIQKDPTDLNIAVYLVSEFKRQNKLDSAKIYLDIAIKSKKVSYDFYNTFADYLVQNNNLDSATLMYKKAIDLDTSKMVKNYRIIANLYLRKNDPINAEKYYLALLKINPNDLDCLNEIGIVYLKKMEYKKAIFYLNNAIQIDPTFKNAYTNLIIYYKSINNKTELIKLIQKAKENNVQL